VTAEEDKATFPDFKTNGMPKFPMVGEEIYVPTCTGVNCYIVGGRAKVKQILGPTKIEQGGRPSARNSVKNANIEVEEHPGQLFKWSDLRDTQYALWMEFKSNRTRMATMEEGEEIRLRDQRRTEALNELRVEREEEFRERPWSGDGSGKPSPPTHSLKVQEAGSSWWATVGAGWQRTDGSFYVKLNPGTVLSWRDDIKIGLFPPKRRY
jgi:hypothetical protein